MYLLNISSLVLFRCTSRLYCYNFILFFFYFYNTDINECLSESYKCEGGTCQNTIGSWNCTCYDGYKEISEIGRHKICKGRFNFILIIYDILIL